MSILKGNDGIDNEDQVSKRKKKSVIKLKEKLGGEVSPYNPRSVSELRHQGYSGQNFVANIQQQIFVDKKLADDPSSSKKSPHEIFSKEDYTFPHDSNIYDKTHYIPNMPNSRDFIFRLVPKLSYEVHQEYSKTIQQYKILIRARKNEGSIDNPNDPIRNSIERKLQKLQEKLAEEQKSNELRIKEYENQPVKLGANLQLMHHDSGCYIAARKDCSNTGKIGYNCELSKWYGPEMVFRIMPKYKSRSEGDKIQYKDSVYIESTFMNTYLSFNVDKQVEIPQSFEKQFYTNPFLVPITNFPIYNFTAYLSQVKEMSWQICPHSKYIGQNPNIVGNDLIRIRHTESMGNLGSEFKYCKQHPTPEVFIRSYQGEFEEEKDSLNSVWEIEHMKKDYRGDPFVINSVRKDRESKKHEKLSVSLSLRHFITGRYLSCLLLRDPTMTDSKGYISDCV